MSQVDRRRDDCGALLPEVLALLNSCGEQIRNSDLTQMAEHHVPFAPLDPGRINAMDPLELRYWCKELQCTEVELRAAISAVGEHVSAVREQLALGPSAM